MRKQRRKYRNYYGRKPRLNHEQGCVVAFILIIVVFIISTCVYISSLPHPVI